LDSSDQNRLSVTVVDVAGGKEADFVALAEQFGTLLIRKKYGIAEMIRDETHPLRFYAVRRWTDAAAAAACHADPEAQGLTARLYQLARVTHVVNGARSADPLRLMLEDQRARVEADRRGGARASDAAEGTAVWGQGACRTTRERSISWPPRAARGNMPMPPFRTSRWAPRWKPPTAWS
jgi:hypothetical protein